MGRSFLAFLLGLTALGGCAEPSRRYFAPFFPNSQPRPSAAPSRPTSPAVAAKLTRVDSPAEEMARYEKAVAEKLRDPASVRFRNLSVVADEKGRKALCGQVDYRDRAGRYTGYQGFHAPLSISGDAVRTTPALARERGLLYVFERCRVSKGGETPEG